MNWREKIEAQIAKMKRIYRMYPRATIEWEVIATMQALLDDRKRLRAALERIATKPPVNEEYGNQGYDADEMQAMADAALQEGE